MRISDFQQRMIEKRKKFIEENAEQIICREIYV